jgi:hypothetical protein
VSETRHFPRADEPYHHDDRQKNTSWFRFASTPPGKELRLHHRGCAVGGGGCRMRAFAQVSSIRLQARTVMLSRLLSDTPVHRYNWLSKSTVSLCLPTAEEDQRLRVKMDVRCHTLTATSVKMDVLWNVGSRNLVDNDRCFRGAYCLHHQGDDTHVYI